MTYLMNNISFVYCFSKKLAANEEQYAINLLLLEKSIDYLKKFYDFRIITDTATVKDIQYLSNKIQLIDTSNFRFLEDLKLTCICLLKSNEVIIDPDIFVFEQLKLDIDKDIIFEHKDSPKKPWYADYLDELKGTLLYDKIISTGSIPFVPNIGFFRITDKELFSTFVDEYYKYRRDILDKYQQDVGKYNLLLGQYLLGILLYEGNYSYLCLRDTNSVDIYTHMAGPDKYRKFKINKPVI